MQPHWRRFCISNKCSIQSVMPAISSQIGFAKTIIVGGRKFLLKSATQTAMFVPAIMHPFFNNSNTLLAVARQIVHQLH